MLMHSLTMWIVGDLLNGAWSMMRRLSVLFSVHLLLVYSVSDPIAEHIVRETINAFKDYPRMIEPLRLPDFYAVEFKGFPYSVRLNITHSYISGLSKGQIKSVESDLANNTIKLKVLFPKLEYTSRYGHKGKIISSKTSGIGYLKVTVTNGTCEAIVTFKMKNLLLLLDNVVYDYQIENLQVKVVETRSALGVGHAIIEKVIHDYVIRYKKDILSYLSYLTISSCNYLTPSVADILKMIYNYLH